MAAILGLNEMIAMTSHDNFDVGHLSNHCDDNKNLCEGQGWLLRCNFFFFFFFSASQTVKKVIEITLTCLVRWRVVQLTARTGRGNWQVREGHTVGTVGEASAYSLKKSGQNRVTCMENGT